MMHTRSEPFPRGWTFTTGDPIAGRVVIAGNRVAAGSASAPAVHGAAPARTSLRRGTRPSRSVPLPVEIALERIVAKRPQTRAGFWRFYGTEYGRIAEFGRSTHTLDLAVLSPRLRPDRRLVTRLAPSLQAWASELLPLLGLLLDEGWRVLSKRDYNRVVLLLKLCELILSVDVASLDFDEEESLERLRPIETLFYLLHGAPGNAEHLAECVSQALAARPDLRHGEPWRAALLAKRILYREYELPSLFNMLLIIDMVRLRRYLAPEELIAPGLDGLLVADDYVCSPFVRERIDRFVDELKSALRLLDESRSAARKMRSYLPLRVDGSIDYADLLQLCRTGLEDEASRQLLADRDDILFPVLRVLSLFDETFAPLLAGRVGISGGSALRLFTPGFFGDDLASLRDAEATVRRLSFVLRSMPQQRYLSVKRRRTGCLEAELDTVIEIEKALRILFGIGRRLSRLLGLPVGGSISASLPLEPVALHATQVSLPRADRTIRTPGTAIDGKSVREALGFAARIAFLAVSLFDGQEFVHSRFEDEAIAKRFRGMLRELRRLVDDRSYALFVARLRTAEERRLPRPPEEAKRA